MPQEFHEVFAYLKRNVRNIDKVVLSVHCHNDLGMAVANSLAAVRAGARQIECTINGIGERAGNCSLEEIVMALKTRESFFGCAPDINTTRLYPTSRLVSQITGMPIPRNKAIVGENAFAHESGIHQDGMLKHALDLRNHAPAGRRLSRTNLVLGKHSGRHAFRERVQGARLRTSTTPNSIACSRNSRRSPTRKRNSSTATSKRWSCVRRTQPKVRGTLRELQRHTPIRSAARKVTLHLHAHRWTQRRPADATAEGPVDAVVKAIDAATGISVQVRKFEVHSVSVGEDAQGEALLTVEHNGRSYRGAGVSTNIIEAAARSYLEVINRIEATRQSAERNRRRTTYSRPLRHSPRSRIRARRYSTRTRSIDCMPITAAKHIWYNGKLVPWEKATVHVLAHALHYGSTVFEGERAYATPNGPVIFRLRDHTRRLFDSAKIYRIDIPYTPEQINAACKEIISGQ